MMCRRREPRELISGHSLGAKEESSTSGSRIVVPPAQRPEQRRLSEAFDNQVPGGLGGSITAAAPTFWALLTPTTPALASSVSLQLPHPVPSSPSDQLDPARTPASALLKPPVLSTDRPSSTIHYPKLVLARETIP